VQDYSSPDYRRTRTRIIKEARREKNHIVTANALPRVKDESADVLIIGAGAAGLAAARDLGVAGRKVVVLEARDRVGGRIFTYKHPSEPSPIELGAEFVHGKSPELWRIAQRAHLDLYEVGGRHLYFENCKLNRSVSFRATIESLNERMKASRADQSLEDFLATLPDDEETRRAKAIVIRYAEGFHAGRINRIGIHGLIKANEAADSIEGDKAFRFLNGYDSLVQALRADAESHGATILLNTTVKEIRWSGDGVEAVSAGGSGDGSFAASRAIITLPLGVMQTSRGQPASVRFIPELPPEKQGAIKHLEMGHVLRVVLSFREPFWENLTTWDERNEPVKFVDAGFIHCPDMVIPTWWTQLPIRAPVLVGWVGGQNADRISEGAIEGRYVDESAESKRGYLAHTAGKSVGSLVRDQAINSLARLFDLSSEYIRDQLRAAHFHDWQHDQFSRGAYAYLPVNGLDDQILLSQTVDGVLFFAGEATSVGHIGTVHGAIMSGQRAAREVLGKA
jgi:monoamine oxidase